MEREIRRRAKRRNSREGGDSSLFTVIGDLAFGLVHLG